MAYFAEIELGITDYFVSNWSTTPIDVANGDFRFPQAGSWVRITVNPAGNFSVYDGYTTAAGVEIRETGTITVQIFSPVKQGSGDSVRLADQLFDLFVNKRIGNIKSRVPSVQRIGVREGWYQVNVVIPYSYDVILTEA